MPSYADDETYRWKKVSDKRNALRRKLIAKGVVDGGSKMMMLLSKVR